MMTKPLVSMTKHLGTPNIMYSVYYLAALDSSLVQDTSVCTVQVLCRSSPEISSKVQILEGYRNCNVIQPKMKMLSSVSHASP